MPLQTRLCDAQILQGCPMLSSLCSPSSGSQHDADYLRQYCAVCSANSKLYSLYILARSKKPPWRTLRNTTCHFEDPENTWRYDVLLDPDRPLQNGGIDESDRPFVGENLAPIARLKRPVSKIKGSPNFSVGTIGKGDGYKSKRTKSERKRPRYLPV
jgi:hypothetical protein